MTEEKKEQEKSYVIVDQVLDGVKSRAIKSKIDDSVIMTLPETYSDEECDFVFKLCDDYFQKGIAFGVKRMQADLQRLLGINTSPAN